MHVFCAVAYNGDQLQQMSYYCMSTLHLHPELSSDPEKVEEDTKHQGSMVSNARSFIRKQVLVTTHQGVTYASSLTMQVPSEPAERESDPHEEPEPAVVKGECWFPSPLKDM